jgi:hypothetical protein
VSNSRDSLKSQERESQWHPPYSRLNLVRIVPLCQTETHKELTMHKRAQVIVTMHALKHKTRTKEEHMQGLI